MTKSSIWLHHGGSGKFLSSLVESTILKKRTDINQLIEHIDLTKFGTMVNPKSVFNAETARAAVSLKCFVVGSGFFEIIMNDAIEVADQNEKISPSECEVCGLPAIDCYFSPCGHSIYCKKCWDSLTIKPVKCELCQTDIESTTSPIDCSIAADTPKTCGICFESYADTIIVPCGHTICYKCAHHWFSSSYKCPFCRGENSRFRRYVPYK